MYINSFSETKTKKIANTDIQSQMSSALSSPVMQSSTKTEVGSGRMDINMSSLKVEYPDA